jgi:hypothetical protein
MKIIKLISTLSFMFIYLSMFSPVAVAQTPDGETPANEGVCDELIGLTPGLYGLCVGFCEAQDAEATFDVATQTITFAPGTKPSNPKLLELYNKKKVMGTDSDMPCVNVVEPPAPVTCPCWTEPELDGINPSSDATGPLACRLRVGSAGTTSSMHEPLLYGTIRPLAYAGGFGSTSQPYFCGARLLTGYSPYGSPTFNYRFQYITAEEWTACTESIATECLDRGL